MSIAELHETGALKVQRTLPRVKRQLEALIQALMADANNAALFGTHAAAAIISTIDAAVPRSLQSRRRSPCRLARPARHMSRLAQHLEINCDW